MIESQAAIRRATPNDLQVLGSYGGKLAHQHRGYDPRRFALFEPVEAEFARFYEEQLCREDAAILVAELAGRVVGYAFVRVEPESFVDALAATAWIHDIYIDESARGHGVGTRLMGATIAAAKELGSNNLMLSVAAQNEGARRVFEKHSFRLTMHEMRLDLAEAVTQ